MQQRDIMSGLAKGLSAIETFTADAPRQSITQVAAASGLDRATARRCLLTLAHLGFADYDGKFFTLTPRIMRLGTACLATMPLPQIVQPWLDRLSDELGESTSVSILDGEEIVYIARAAQRKVMSISLTPGSRLPAHCTSMGRVMLAALGPDEVPTTPLTAFTPHTITSHDLLLAELKTVQSQGYAIIDQEVELGLISIAVPIYDARGQVVAALNLGLSTHNMSADQLAKKYLGKLNAIQSELRKVLM
jgi:IclR family pca regulon transcriptional regulator